MNPTAAALDHPAKGSFDPIPSTRNRPSVTVVTALPTPEVADALAVPVTQDAEPPAELGVDAAALKSAGFTGKRGETLVVPHTSAPQGVALVAIGVGPSGDVDLTALRDLAADFARAVPQHKRLAVELPQDASLSATDFAQAVTEGVLLARWRFHVGESDDDPPRAARPRRPRRSGPTLP